VLFVGHSAKTSLPRAALGKVLHSVSISFIECRTLGTEIHSVKTSLSSGKHSANVALSKKTVSDRSKADGRQPLPRAEGRHSAKRFLCRVSHTWHSAKNSLPSVFCGHSAKHIFIFKILSTKLFVVCFYTM
jgi:hypothetical protein